MTRAIVYTHFINDKANPDRAVIFRAYKCLSCGQLHRTANNVESFMPWGKASLSLIQVDTGELPRVGCSDKIMSASDAPV